MTFGPPFKGTLDATDVKMTALSQGMSLFILYVSKT